jgi:hypothetical protein
MNFIPNTGMMPFSMHLKIFGSFKPFVYREVDAGSWIFREK